MSIVSKIKSSIQKSGGSKGKIIKIAPDKKGRIRFLEDFEQGREFTFHNGFKLGIDAICRKHFGEECPYCEEENEEIRTEQRWAWSAWDCDGKETKVFLWKATSMSPVSQLINYYETYGTIIDRDYVIARTGSQLDTKYQVMPMDKAKFRNEKAKAYSESGLLKLLDKAFPLKDFDEDEEEEEAPKKKGKKAEPAKASKKKPVEEEAEELDVEWIEEKLESEDIDEEEFCEYHEIKNLKKLTKKSKKEIKAMIRDFIDNGADDDDEDEDEDEDE